MCVYLCVFKLDITTQSGPVILVILCHSPRGDQLWLYRKPLTKRDKGDTLSLLVQILRKPWIPCAPPPASLFFSRLSGLAATGPTLYFLRFSLFPPKSPPFPTWRLQVLCGFLRFFTSPPPSPIISSFPFPSSSP